MISAVITAAGRGTRMGAAGNKVFLKIGNKTVLEHTAAAFFECGDVDEIIITAAPLEIARCEELFKSAPKPVKTVMGGASRQESVKNGIAAASGEIVLIHDGARALITPELIKKAADACREYGAAALGVPVKDTVKKIGGEGFIEKTLDRDFIYLAQTPQAFYRDLIWKAHKLAFGNCATDDCALAEAAGERVKMVMGSYENIKLTTPEDMVTAEAILKKRGRIE